MFFGSNCVIYNISKFVTKCLKWVSCKRTFATLLSSSLDIWPMVEWGGKLPLPIRHRCQRCLRAPRPLQGQERPWRLDLRRLHRRHDPHCRLHDGARHHHPECRCPHRKLQHLSKSMLANWYHQGECFCGAEGHTPECPDLVNSLIAPAMQVNVWIQIFETLLI